MFNSQMMELRSNLQAEQTQKRNQFEIEKAQINLKLEMEKNRAELSESSLKRCEDELLRTKLNLQNQIEKDETYYRDEIAKLKDGAQMFEAVSTWVEGMKTHLVPSWSHSQWFLNAGVFLEPGREGQRRRQLQN